MDWDSSNLPDAWRRFKQHVELMFSGPLKERSEEQKCSFLLLWIGDKGRDISNTWQLTEDEAKLLKTYYDGFTKYLTPKANPIFARYKFHEKTQDSDRIVFGTNSPHVREKLLSQGPTLTLEKAIDIARSYELAQSQLKAMANDNHEFHCGPNCSTSRVPTKKSALCPERPPQIRAGEYGEGQDHTKVTEPTKWVNALVICENPKRPKLRLCLDPRPLNKAIMRPHYPLPTLEDVTHKLAGAKFFSILDARSGYWAIKLSEESSFLTTFNTIYGRYRFLRLPFGIVSAQDEFQRRIDETYEGLEGVAGIVDDIIVFGKTKEEHEKNLKAMLNRTREKGLKLNPDKCRICVTEVSFFGHKLTANGLKPDPLKICPNLAEMSAPLRLLLRQDAPFKWEENHERAFKQIKDTLTAEPGPVLAYFDPQKEVTLQPKMNNSLPSDASSGQAGRTHAKNAQNFGAGLAPAGRGAALSVEYSHSNAAPQLKHNPWSLKCHQHTAENEGEAKHRNQYKFILLENLTWRHTVPCVLDLKMGTRQHGDDASEEKKAIRCANASKVHHLHRVRLCGMQVFQSDTGKLMFMNKYHGRKLTPEWLQRGALPFFHSGRALRRELLSPILQGSVT
ncbi:hypothetical protein WMY93_004162 [Mugilogobius chulae]|uniref:ribonuclease H n=1 Tax=Mugilogobius chulae TaxID=88201 RepID=A0AAW0PYG5_9GOBI